MSSTNNGLQMKGMPPTINNVNIVKSKTNGITYEHYLHADLSLVAINVSAIDHNGVKLSPQNPLTVDVSVVDSLLSGCGDACLLYDGIGNLTIDSTQVSHALRWGVLEQFKSNQNNEYGSVVIRNSVISDNERGGMQLHQAHSYHLVNNTFISNSELDSLHIASSSYRTTPQDITLEGNQFIDNMNYEEFYSWGTRVYLYAVANIQSQMATLVVG